MGTLNSHSRCGSLAIFVFWQSEFAFSLWSPGDFCVLTLGILNGSLKFPDAFRFSTGYQDLVVDACRVDAAERPAASAIASSIRAMKRGASYRGSSTSESAYV